MQRILHPAPFVSSSRMVSVLKTSWNILRQWQKYIPTASLHPLILRDLVVTSELWLSSYIQGSFQMPQKAALLPRNPWKQLCRTAGHVPILFHCLWPIAVGSGIFWGWTAPTTSHCAFYKRIGNAEQVPALVKLWREHWREHYSLKQIKISEGDCVENNHMLGKSGSVCLVTTRGQGISFPLHLKSNISKSLELGYYFSWDCSVQKFHL